MDSPLALYRRYRPETFAEVIGQEHVTEPLRAALANNRVNHAYLFSGPRGCGKTTSARILARALNCEKAPIADPCGECDSCRDLARNGPGSIDVIEIDAASHGGVDDARDLREKAFFAPVKSRYKVYIIDEAHMVTTQGFNALLKLVEEPPPHLRFIFATTEPEKVIPTIRSRTHHYPFRLIPPRLLTGYLSELCDREGVAIEPAALPLVVRAGAGSARDTLSVLDQLLGGAGPAGVTHDLATGLLGYTPDTLLDDVVDAFAAGDGAGVFGVVDRVIETGQDPRRFTEDLLRRLRDLVIVAAVPDAPATGLIDVAADQAERLVAQAARFGRSDLTRAADLVAAGLTDMRGATAPRLLLELICARVLLPGADHSADGVMARLDRLERRIAITGTPTAAPAPAPAAAPGQDRPQPSRAERAAPERVEQPAPSTERPAPAPAPTAAPISSTPPEASISSTPPEASISSTPPEASISSTPPEASISSTPPEASISSTPPASPEPASPEPASHEPSAPDPAPAQGDQTAPAAVAEAPSAASGLSLVDVRRLWPEVVDRSKAAKRLTWIHLTQNAQVVGFDGATLTLGFANAGARGSFDSGPHTDIVRQLVIDVVGADIRIETIIDPGADASAGPPPSRSAPEPPREQASPRVERPVADQQPPPLDDGPPPPWDPPEPDGPDAPDHGTPTRETPQSRREMVDEIQAQARAERQTPALDPDAAVNFDDADVDAESSTELLTRELGARMIEEIPNE
ncbi:DNA polymerase III subunit gamma and tau [Nocardioides sp. BGMRC 2183]|nr:DNA polymerase III subunit gamma and tau [Nocardioides sp. BGMRC 2183]